MITSPIYDSHLGGKDNFAADRGGQIEAIPDIAAIGA